MRLILLFLFGMSTLFSATIASAAPLEWPERLRGINVTTTSMTADLFTLLEETKVNVIRFNFKADSTNAPTASDPLIPYPRDLAALDAALPMARAAGIKLIFCASNIYGRDLDVMWGDTENGLAVRDHLSDFWGAIAERYQDESAIIAYDIFNEPNYPSGQAALWYDEMLPQSIAAIRAVNTNIWLVVEPGPWGLPGGFASMPLVNDPYVVYSFHHYAPHSYTHQGINAYAGYEATYPGTNKMFNTSPLYYWGKEELRDSMQDAIDFAQTHNVRMLVGEFSPIRWADGAATWLEDSISLFEEQGWDWCFHSIGGWNGWNPTYGPTAPDNLTAPDGGERTDRWNVLMNYWNMNQFASPTLLLAGWEKGLNPGPGLAPTQVLPDFTGMSSATVDGGSTQWVQDWQRASNDGTFGTLGNAPFDNIDEGGYSLSGDAAMTSATLRYSVTNQSAIAYELTYLSFDARQAYGTDTPYTIHSVGGDITISNDIGSGIISRYSSFPSTESDFDDFDVSLAGLADRTLAPGESATFEMVFTEMSAGALRVDNVGIFGKALLVPVIAHLVGLHPFSGSVMELVAYTTDPSATSLKMTTDLSEPWTNIAHSVDGSAPFVETNLSYSSASGTNVVIYVDTPAKVQFFKLNTK